MRADEFFKEKEGKLKRRNSFANDFSVQRYFHLVKVRPQKVFHSACFGQVDKIIEVKNIKKIREQLTKHTAVPDELKKGQANVPEDSTSLYAVVSSEGGTVQILNITNLSCELVQYSGICG